jgi:hypothetical protein
LQLLIVAIMARKKTTPIDVRRYKSITSIPAAFFRGIVEAADVARDHDHVVRAKQEPPLVSFDSNEKIRQIQAMLAHEEKNDCFEFKCNWISQAVAMSAQGISPTDITGFYGLDQEPPKLTPKQRSRITKRHGARMKKYNQTSMRFKTSGRHKETETRPKQAEFPPLDQLILELAKQEASGTSAGRTSVLEYWRDCQDKAARGDLEIVNEPPIEEVNSERASQQSSETEFEFEQYVPPSRQLRANVAALADNIAHRNCRTCYKRHYKCDRTLPTCSLCAASDADCVYLEVSPSVKSSSSGD